MFNKMVVFTYCVILFLCLVILIEIIAWTGFRYSPLHSLLIQETEAEGLSERDIVHSMPITTLGKNGITEVVTLNCIKQDKFKELMKPRCAWIDHEMHGCTVTDCRLVCENQKAFDKWTEGHNIKTINAYVIKGK